MNLKGNRMFRMLAATAKDFSEDRALQLSAALAYYSIFSIAPLLIIAISIAGIAFGQEAVQGQVAETLKSYIGEKPAEGVQALIAGAAKPGGGIIGMTVGFVVLLFGASGVFGQLKEALNIIWEVKTKPSSGVMGFIRQRLLSFGMVLAIGFLLLTSLLLTTALAALGKFAGDALSVPVAVWNVAGFAISFTLVTLLFALIFKMLPDAKVEWRSVWVGAIATAVLFELGKLGLSYYIGRESMASSYGAAGSLVLLLLWIYYASCILFFGAEFTQVYARETGHRIEAADHATFTEEAAGAQPPLPQPKKEELTTMFALEERDPEPEPERVAETLLAVTGASFLIGLLARWGVRRADPPATRIRDGFAELGAQAAHDVARWWKHARRG